MGVGSNVKRRVWSESRGKCQGIHKITFQEAMNLDLEDLHIVGGGSGKPPVAYISGIQTVIRGLKSG